MMKKIIFLLLILHIHLTYSQERIIELKKEPINIGTNSFYIENVIDGRENQDNIGYVHTGIFNRKVEAKLVGGVENAVYDFLKGSIQMNYNATPIVLKITYLSISEERHFLYQDGIAEIKIEFYKLDSQKLGKIFYAETFIEEPKADVTKDHNKRIKKGLIVCMRKFINSDWQSVKPIYKDIDSILVEKTNTNRISYAEINIDTKKWNNLISLNKSFGVNAENFGLTYYGYTPNEKRDWIFPYIISIEFNTIINNEYLNKNEFREVDINYYMAGISAFRRLKENLYLNLAAKIPIGIETYTDYNDNQTNNFVIGIEPSEGIYYIPSKDFGIYFGIGTYQKLLNSKLFKVDIGLNFEIGIKF